jgi:glycosyltransferase involved in cell wall biosynthesis
MSQARFVIASPGHASIYDYEALALHERDLLRFIAMGTRRGVAGLPAEVTRLLPSIGLLNYIGANTMSRFAAESFRFRMHPWFDRWVKKQLRPGDHIISSYGYANASFEWTRANGGKTFLDAGNSHPDNFWTILKEEQRRWNSPVEPVARHHYERSLRMLEHVDYVLSASSFVTRSFLERGYKSERILPHARPIELADFHPAETARPKDRPFTVIGTGTLCLRKGSPYLLESFRLLQKKIPGVRFILRRDVADDFKPLLPQYRDLPITWLEMMPHAELAAHIRQADIFILPSLEDGLALTVLEALASGLPVITTPNTGASDYIRNGINGEVVPIRDAQAIADAVLKWSDRILSASNPPTRLIDPELVSMSHFKRQFLGQLESLNLVPRCQSLECGGVSPYIGRDV